MLTRKSADHRKKIILWLLLIILTMAIIFLLVFNFGADFLTGNLDPTEGEVQFRSTSAQFEDDFLKDPVYVKLQQYVTLPVQVDVIGRANPFSKIQFNQ